MASHVFKSFQYITGIQRTISNAHIKMSGPVETCIRNKLTEAFKPSHLEVINESYKHNVPKEAEMHFQVVIVSDAFDSLTTIKRHRLVNTALKEQFDAGLHALTIVTKTEQQWKESQAVPESPKCLGGAKF